MQREPVVAFRHIDPSPAVEELLSRRIAALSRIERHVIGCAVSVETPPGRRLRGRLVSVHVEIEVAEPDLSVSREIARGGAADDVALAVNRAFAAAERMLRRHAERSEAPAIGLSAPVLHGTVWRVEPDLGWGWIRADDGRDVHFRKDALGPGHWDRLAEGARLRFRAIEGEEGPRAVAVALAD